MSISSHGPQESESEASPPETGQTGCSMVVVFGIPLNASGFSSCSREAEVGSASVSQSKLAMISNVRSAQGSVADR